MKNLSCTFIAFVFCFNFSNAQSYEVNPMGFLVNPMGFRLSSNHDYYRDLAIAVENLDEFSWQNASLDINGELKTVAARYNPVKGVVEIKYDEQEYEIAKRNNFSFTFKDGDKTYQLKSYYGDDGKIYNSYFIVDDFAEELGVLKKEGFTKTKAKQSQYFSTQKEGVEIVKNDVYYLINNDNKLFHLTTNRRVIKKSFPEDASSIIKYIKKNKLRESNYDDIIELAKYIKTLDI